MHVVYNSHTINFFVLLCVVLAKKMGGDPARQNHIAQALKNLALRKLKSKLSQEICRLIGLGMS